MRKILLTAVLLSIAGPAFACGNGECDPEPPAPPPVTVTTPQSGGSIYDPAGEVFYAYCLCNGEYAVARGFSLRTPEFRAQAARAQCEALNHKRRCAISDDRYVGGKR